MKVSDKMFDVACQLKQIDSTREMLISKLNRLFEIEYKGYVFRPMLDLCYNFDSILDNLLINHIDHIDQNIEYIASPINGSKKFNGETFEALLVKGILTENNIGKYVTTANIKEWTRELTDEELKELGY